MEKKREKNITRRRNIRKFKVHSPLKQNRVAQGEQEKRQVQKMMLKRLGERPSQVPYAGMKI